LSKKTSSFYISWTKHYFFMCRQKQSHPDHNWFWREKSAYRWSGVERIF